MNFIDFCRKAISIDSSPSASALELAQYFEKLAADLGLQAELISEVQNGVTQANIIIKTDSYKAGEPEFLLQAHLDTVDPVSFSLWKKNDFNPFDAVIDDGKIYGLGAAEVKLDFLCKLFALSKFKDKKTNVLNPVLIGTFGEETGMQGALRLIRKNKINAKYALVGEASNLQIIHAAKGFATVEIRIPFSESELKYKSSRAQGELNTTETKLFSGKSAHSSTPHLGDNAIEKMFDFLNKMPENMVVVEIDGGTRFNMIPSQAMVEIDMTSPIQEPVLVKINKIYKVLKEVEADMQKFADSDFEPGFSTLSIGIVRTFDDSILVGGSCRILPNITQEQYEVWMKKIETVCSDCGAVFRITDYKRPFRTNDSSVLIKAAQSVLSNMGLNSNCQTLASTNEASLFSRLNIECICFGAGVREGNVHTPEEHVKIEDLDKSILFYEKMIERFCI